MPKKTRVFKSWLPNFPREPTSQPTTLFPPQLSKNIKPKNTDRVFLQHSASEPLKWHSHIPNRKAEGGFCGQSFKIHKSFPPSSYSHRPEATLPCLKKTRLSNVFKLVASLHRNVPEIIICSHCPQRILQATLEMLPAPSCLLKLSTICPRIKSQI